MAWQQSMLAPGGPDAQAIAKLAWILFGGGAVIFLGVLVLTVLAHWGGIGLRRRLGSTAFVVFAGVVFPLVTLTTLLVHGLLLTGSRVMAAGADVLHIDVVGEQWWWRVYYPPSARGQGAMTANEIRIPAGRDVEI